MASGSQMSYGCHGEPRIKTEQSKRLEAIREIQQLKIKIQNFEKERKTHIYSKLSDFHKEFSTLEELDQKLAADRKSEKTKIMQHLNKVKNMVKKFQRELKGIKPTPEVVEQLKVIMEDTERQISDFKDQQRAQYEELLRDERLTSQEVMALEQKFESWSKLLSANAVTQRGGKTSAPLASHRDITRDLPPEVADFERFVQQTGGPRGGWDEYDHATFLKYRNRHRGKSTFLQECISFLPTRTEQEIKDHEAWYQEYLSRNEKKKDAINRWKERKENEKVAAQADLEDEKDKEEEERRKEAKRQEILERDRQERKVHLNSWRVEKELKKAEEEERKLREELRKVQKEEKERQRKMELKAQVDEYRQAKKQEEEEKLLERKLQEDEEAEFKRQEALHAISKFRERDLKAVKEKVAKDKAKEQEQLEKRKRLEKIRNQVKVERDPSRLLKPTKGWEERQKDRSSESGGQVIHMPHRAVPTWRQGMF